MPISRYQLRSEYSLADPELYRAADRDDPEALLEGVAMAGLVGVLRQLGDLAEFAAEIFHELHEEVMATAARGHGLMIRVQQLEAEFPSIEKAFLSRTSHSDFIENAGIDWHANLRMDQNVITQGDLPRFVMDSYEECRGPPRLFLLDKFDVAGAGACLKRYSDPSFYKTELGSTETKNSKFQREKKSRKIKKRGARLRKGGTPDIFSTSQFNSMLHQLASDEKNMPEKDQKVPTYGVKLKKGHLSSASFNSRTERSYMEHILEIHPCKNKTAFDNSWHTSHLKIESSDVRESGPEIYEISVEDSTNELMKERTPILLPKRHVPALIADELAEDVNKGGNLKSLPEVTSNPELDNSATFHQVGQKCYVVSGGSKREASVDGCRSDDFGIEEIPTINEEDHANDGSSTKSRPAKSTSNEFDVEKIPASIHQVYRKDDLLDGKLKPEVDTDSYMSDEFEVEKTATISHLVYQKDLLVDGESKTEANADVSRSENFDVENIPATLFQAGEKDVLVDDKTGKDATFDRYSCDNVEGENFPTMLQRLDHKGVLGGGESKIDGDAGRDMPVDFEVEKKPSTVIEDGRIEAVVDGGYRSTEFVEKLPSTVNHLENKDPSVNDEIMTIVVADGYMSDDATSEMDNYMDALTTMESEMETDTESRARHEMGLFNVVSHEMDSDINAEQELHCQCSDNHSIGGSSTTFSSNSSFKKERPNYSSDSLSNFTDMQSPKGNGTATSDLSENFENSFKVKDAFSGSMPDNSCIEFSIKSSYSIGGDEETEANASPEINSDGIRNISSELLPSNGDMLTAKSLDCIEPIETGNEESDSHHMGLVSPICRSPSVSLNEDQLARSDPSEISSTYIKANASPEIYSDEIHNISSELLPSNGDMLTTKSLDCIEPVETGNEESDSHHMGLVSPICRSPSASLNEDQLAISDPSEISSIYIKDCTEETGKHTGDDLQHPSKISGLTSEITAPSPTEFSEDFTGKMLVGGIHDPPLYSLPNSSDITAMPGGTEENDEVLATGVTTECSSDYLQVTEVCDLPTGTIDDSTLEPIRAECVEDFASAGNVRHEMLDSPNSISFSVEKQLCISTKQDCADAFLDGKSQPECFPVSCTDLVDMQANHLIMVENGFTLGNSENLKPADEVKESSEFTVHKHVEPNTCILPLESESCCCGEPCKCHVVDLAEVPSPCSGSETLLSKRIEVLSHTSELEESEEPLPERTHPNSLVVMGNTSEAVGLPSDAAFQELTNKDHTQWDDLISGSVDSAMDVSEAVDLPSNAPLQELTNKDHTQSDDLISGSVDSAMDPSDAVDLSSFAVASNPLLHNLTNEDRTKLDDLASGCSLVVTTCNDSSPEPTGSAEACDDHIQLQEEHPSEPASNLYESEINDSAEHENRLESDAQKNCALARSEYGGALPEFALRDCSPDYLHHVVPSDDWQSQLQLLNGPEGDISLTGSAQDSELKLREENGLSILGSVHHCYPHEGTASLEQDIEVVNRNCMPSVNKEEEHCRSSDVPVQRMEVDAPYDDLQRPSEHEKQMDPPAIHDTIVDNELKTSPPPPPLPAIPISTLLDLGACIPLRPDHNLESSELSLSSCSSSNLTTSSLIIPSIGLSTPETTNQGSSGAEKCVSLQPDNTVSSELISSDLSVPSISTPIVPNVDLFASELTYQGTLVSDTNRSLGISLPVSNVPPTDLEGMPPLPPLPPLEWRMGKVRHGFPTLGGELAQPVDTLSPLLTIKDGKAQHGSLLYEGDISRPSNPLAPLSTMEDEKHQYGSLPLGREMVQPSNSLLQLPTVGGVKPSLTLEGQVLQPPSSSIPLSVVKDKSDHCTIPTLEGITQQPPNPLPQLENVEEEHPKANLHLEPNQPKDSLIVGGGGPFLALEEQMLQPPSMSMSLRGVEDENPLHVMPASEGITEQSLNPFPQLQTVEDERPRGNLHLGPNQDSPHVKPALEGVTEQSLNPFPQLRTVEDERPRGNLHLGPNQESSHVMPASEGFTEQSLNPLPQLQILEDENPEGNHHLGPNQPKDSLIVGGRGPFLALEEQMPQPPSMSMSLRGVEDENPLRVMPASEGITEQSLNPFPQLQTVEDERPRGNLHLGPNQESPHVKHALEGVTEQSLNLFPQLQTVEDERPRGNLHLEPNQEIPHVMPASEGFTEQSLNSLPQLQILEDENPEGNHHLGPNQPKDPLIEAIASHDRRMLRRASERIQSVTRPKADDRNSLLEQIRAKSFNLKPAVVTKPIVQGPKTNLNVVAILEKANAIRQAFAGSDEDDDSDTWSDS